MRRLVDRHFLLDFTRSVRAGESSVELPTGDTEYQVRAKGQSRPEVIEIRWSERFIERLQELREHTEGSVGETAAFVGQRLAEFLSTPGWSVAAQEIAQGSDEEPTFLTVRSNASEVYLLPWELLSIGNVTHAGSLSKLLIRYEWPDTRTAPRRPGLSQTKRGRIIFAWSAAGGKVDAARHVKLIERAIDAGRGSFDDDRDRAFEELKNASYESIRASLERAKSANEPVAVLHLLCHGGEERGAFGLVLNDGDDEARDVVSPSRLQMLLKDYAGLVRLVVLSACDAGNSGAVGAQLGSAAQEIHKAGVGAVIASRFPLSWDGARVFAAELYDGILGGLTSLEDAFLAARAKLSRRPTYDWASLQLYAREADGDGTFVFNARPYRGLAAFAPEHARFFFGRDTEIDELVRDLDGLVAQRLPRFLVVSGASGTGKSSMVLGGAVPRWKQSSADGGFAHLVVRPGAAPAEALAQIRARIEIVGEVCKRLLVVVDQFEEVFTHEDAAGATALARALWDMACEPDSPVCVLVTLRIDFLARCNELVIDDAGLRFDKVACDPAHQVLVAQMSPGQLMEAIERPARSAGLSMEAVLAEDVVRDVEAAPGALPLMSHALYLLWSSREGATLTRAAYKALGSVQGALDAHAEAQLQSLGDDADRTAVRRLMVGLIHPGAAGAPDTRRRRAVADLRQGFGAEHERFERVLKRLVDARLLVTGGGDGGAQTVEVAHEALIRSWKSFKGWIDADRTLLAQLAQLDVWASEWRSRPDAILRDSRLGYAEEVEKDHAGDLSGDVRGLLDVSRAERAREAVAALRSKRQWRVVQISILVVVTAFAIGAIALRQGAEAARARAVEQQHIAEREVLAAQTSEAWSRATALRARGETPGQELENLAEALVLRRDMAPKLTLLPAGVDAVLFQAAVAALTRPSLRSDLGEVRERSFSPDGTRFAVRGFGAVYLWDARSGGLVAECRGHQQGDLWLGAAPFTPDSERLIVMFANGTARSWSARDGASDVALGDGLPLADPTPTGPQGVPDVEEHSTLSSDAALVVQGGVVRRTTDGGSVVTLPASESPLDLRLQSGGHRVITVSRDSTLRTWEGPGASLVTTVAVTRARRAVDLVAAVFSRDGSRVLTRPYVGRACVWSVADGGLVAELEDAGAVVPTRFSPDGRLLLGESAPGLGASNAGTTIWDAASGRRLRAGGHGVVRAHSSDGSQLLATSTDAHSVYLQDVAGESAVALAFGSAAVLDAAFAPGGVSLVVAPSERSLHLWNEGDGAVVRTLGGRQAAMHAVAFTPDGAALFTTSSRAVQRWSAREGDASWTLRDSPNVVTARLSPDGRSIAVLHGDRIARVWSAPDGALLHTLGRWGPDSTFDSDGGAAHAVQRDEVRFSPDGARILTTAIEGDPESAQEAEGYEVRLWDAGSGRMLRALQPRSHGGVATARFMPAGARVFTTLADFSARIWDADTGAVVADLPATHGEFVAVAFSSDRARIFTAHASGELCTWDAATGRPLSTSQPSRHAVTRATFSSDGARLFTASDDHLDRLFDFASGTLLGTLQRSAGSSRVEVFSPDRRSIATAYDDGSLSLWSASDARLLATIPAHLAAVIDVAFSPDSARLATASLDGSARLWNLDPAVITRAACALVRARPIWQNSAPLRDACRE